MHETTNCRISKVTKNQVLLELNVFNADAAVVQCANYLKVKNTSHINGISVVAAEEIHANANETEKNEEILSSPKKKGKFTIFSSEETCTPLVEKNPPGDFPKVVNSSAFQKSLESTPCAAKTEKNFLIGRRNTVSQIPVTSSSQYAKFGQSPMIVNCDILPSSLISPGNMRTIPSTSLQSTDDANDESNFLSLVDESQELFDIATSSEVSKGSRNFQEESAADVFFPEISQNTLHEIERATKTIQTEQQQKSSQAKSASLDSMESENPFLKQTGCFAGFQTAGGKALKVASENSLKKAQMILGNDICTFSNHNEDSYGLPGSKEELLSPMAVFEKSDVKLENDENETDRSLLKATPFPLFQTAKGTKLPTPTSSSLKKVANIFKDAVEVPKKPLTSFQTKTSLMWPQNQSAFGKRSTLPFKIPKTVPQAQKNLISAAAAVDTKTENPKSCFSFVDNESRVELKQFVAQMRLLPLQNEGLQLENDLEALYQFCKELFSKSFPTVTQKWIDNHLFQICWKLFSLQKHCNDSFALNYADFSDELFYRYQEEYFNGNRSIIKKIAEKDDSPSRHMILCVQNVVFEFQNPYLVLSDGWYPIKAKIDEPMKWLVLQKKIFVGLKLRIFGAYLESDSAADGIEVLDAFEKISLKLSTNSVRRCLPFENLGLQPNPCFRVSLRSLFSDGGVAPLVDVVVQRVYPVCYLKNGSLMTEQQFFRSPIGKAALNNEEKEDVDATVLFKFKIAEYSSCESGEAYFTFWRPPEDILFTVKEGVRLKIFNPKVSSYFKGILNLSNTRSTVFEMTKGDSCIIEKCYVPRVLLKCFSLIRPGVESDIEALVDGADSTRSIDDLSSIHLKDSEGNKGIMKASKQFIVDPGSIFQKTAIFKNVFLNYVNPIDLLYIFTFHEQSVIIYR